MDAALRGDVSEAVALPASDVAPRAGIDAARRPAAPVSDARSGFTAAGAGGPGGAALGCGFVSGSSGGRPLSARLLLT